MANTALTRPVVTMDLANRSIGRFGLLANRVMHPLAAGHFGRQVAPLAVISDLKIVPTETGIVAETSFGNINVDQPLYSRLLGKAGVSEIDVPKGTDEEEIGDIFRAVTTKTPANYPGEYLRRNAALLADYADKYQAFMDLTPQIDESGKEFVIGTAAIEKNRSFFDQDASGNFILDPTRKCDIYPIIICIPEDSQVAVYLRQIIDKIKPMIPGNVRHAVQKEGTMHITVFTPENGKDKTLYDAVTKDYHPYYIKLSGIRFMADGVVAAVFEDDGQTEQFRVKALDVFQGGKAPRNIIHTSLLRFLDDIDPGTLAALKRMAEELKDLSSQDLRFQVPRLHCVHETRYLQNESKELE